MADLKLSVDVSDVQKALTATQRYERQINQLAQRYARGQVSSEAYNRGLLQIKRSYEQLGLSSQKATSEVRRYAQQQLKAARDIQQAVVAQNNLAAATQQSTGRMNRMNVVTQQAGYQIGDFLVQVQSGTNPMVAFGQQATQLAGVMTLFGGKMVLIGSILGIVIPLLTAIGAAFMRTRKTAEETGTAFERMSSALDDIESLANPVATSVQGSFQRINTAAQVTLQLFRDIATEQLAMARNEFLGQTGIRQGTRAFDESVTNQFTAEAMSGVGRTMADIAASMGENFRIMGLSVDQAREFDRMLQSVSGTTRDEMAQSFAQVVEKMIEAGLITDETRKLIEQMGTELGLVDALQESVTQGANRQEEIQKRINQLLVERVQAYTETQNFVNSEIDDLNKQIAIQEQIAKYGEDSIQVARLQAQFARNEYEDRLRAAGAADDMVERVMALYDANVLATEEAEKTTRNIEAMDGIGTDNIVAQINNLAVALKTTAENAAMAVGGVRMLAQYQAQGGGGRGEGPQGGVPTPDRFRVTPEIETAYQEYLRNQRKQGGGAKGPDAVERLQEEIAFRQRILNLSEDEKNLQTEIHRITQALGKDRNKYSSDFIENLAQENLAMQEQWSASEELRQQQEKLADSIANSFGDAFMSIVDGTKSAKDAFRSMAADIIKELYRVLVVERMVKSISGALGPGGSAGGFLSRLFGAKESGGSMMAGRPYLVGERGPELVIPGRSSTVTNADLTNKAMGGSNGVTVVNNINVSGGTDPAAIRQEVAKLMPQITNATKSAVIDARRRGGQMKAAFG